jgi:hypothetical protein
MNEKILSNVDPEAVKSLGKIEKSKQRIKIISTIGLIASWLIGCGAAITAVVLNVTSLSGTDATIAMIVGIVGFCLGFIGLVLFTIMMAEADYELYGTQLAKESLLKNNQRKE